jgi:tetratricopeptide (TPR) repeat protein
MQILEKNRQEIEAKANKMSDFLQMEYFEGCLKKNLGIDVNKFCFTRLSELYASKNMFSEAAKYMSAAAGLTVTLKEKIQIYLKEIDLLIKSGAYDKAEFSLRKAMEEVAIEREQREIVNTVVGYYKKQAELFEKSGRSSHAMKIYEKLLTMVGETEKLELKKKLLYLYERLGKVKEYLVLKKQLGVD